MNDIHQEVFREITEAETAGAVFDAVSKLHGRPRKPSGIALVVMAGNKLDRLAEES